MEMINKRVLAGLRNAGMDRDQAEVIATYIPDWSQFTTKADLEDMRAKTKADIQDLRAETKAELARITGRLTGLYWLVGALGVILSILQGMPFLVQLF